MTIAWNAFTPYAALAGGALIGLAAAIFVLFNGRIAGISGILGGLLRHASGGAGWRLAFLARGLCPRHRPAPTTDRRRLGRGGLLPRAGAGGTGHG